MGRKKRRWRKWRARQQSPGIGKLIAWAEWEGEKVSEENHKGVPNTNKSNALR